MTWDDVETAIQDYINQVVNQSGSTIPVIWANQNGRRPNVGYVGLNIIAQARPGQAYQGPVILSNPSDPTTGVQTIALDQDFTVSIQGYGEDMRDPLDAIADSLEDPFWFDALDAVGLAHRQHTPARDVSQIIDLTAERRYVMEWTCGVRREISHSGAPWIETVQYSGTVEKPDASADETVTGTAGI